MDAQFSLDTKIKVGIIGFGRMGRFYWEAMRKSGRWEIAYICDTDPTTRELAKKISPESRVVENDQKIFEDESVQVVGLFTLADSRLEQIEKAIRYGKHIIAEKPVADTMDRTLQRTGTELDIVAFCRNEIFCLVCDRQLIAQI